MSSDLALAAEEVLAFADTVEHGDDELFERVHALVARNIDEAFSLGRCWLASASADRREMGTRFIGVAGVLED